MRVSKFIPIVFIFTALKSNPVVGLNANTPKPVVWTKLGQDTELFCSSGNHAVQSLKICRWTKSPLADDGNRTIVVTSNGDSVTGVTGSLVVGNYSYAGAGMAQGECGLKIHAVTEEQVGTWGCTLIGSDIWIGNIQVALYEKPERPVIDYEYIKNITDLGQGANSTVLCCVDGGKPIEETNLSFIYDGEPVYSRLHKVIGKVPCVEWSNVFTVEDSGKRLKCTVEHPGYSATDDKDDEVIVDVKFPPKFMDIGEEGVTMAFSVGDETGNFTFKVKGNPKPNITLEPNSGDKDETMTTLGFENYAVNMTNISEGNDYEYMVIINQPKSGNFTYVLRAANQHGSQEVVVTIVSPAPGEENSSYWILIIVGAVMTGIFIAIITYMLNHVAVVKGWLCYKNRTQKYPVARRKESPEMEEYFTVPRNDTPEDVRL